MAFGKRSAGDLPPSRIAADDTLGPDEGLLSAPGIGAVRTRVANHGEIDRNFIVLALGVVVLAAGIAVAAPFFFSVIIGGVRPIEQVVAGLDRQQARMALAAEAFPDQDGRAFMTSLATNFPNQHGKLLDTLADTAMAGGDRDALVVATNAWSMDFLPSQLPAISRTGARGFDEGVTLLDNTLKYLEAEAGGCTASKMRQLTLNTNVMAPFTKFDTRAYHFSMQANRSFVDLAAAGKTAPTFDVRITQNDMSALQATFFSMMGDSQVMALVNAAAASQGTSMAGSMGFEAGAASLQAELIDKINFCQLGRTVLMKLKGLPEGTKGRLFGTLMTQDFRSLATGKGFPGLGSGAPLGLLSGR